jgi:hypothetical protein
MAPLHGYRQTSTNGSIRDQFTYIPKNNVVRKNIAFFAALLVDIDLFPQNFPCAQCSALNVANRYQHLKVHVPVKEKR